MKALPGLPGGPMVKLGFPMQGKFPVQFPTCLAGKKTTQNISNRSNIITNAQ